MRRLFQDATSLNPCPKLLLPPCLSSRDSTKLKLPPMIHRAERSIIVLVDQNFQGEVQSNSYQHQSDDSL
uniref:Uncharacterized protein n=1 Tax=Physcomitrium patens TaxID=3218 RepID=A0A7I4CGF1_PHYPA